MLNLINKSIKKERKNSLIKQKINELKILYIYSQQLKVKHEINVKLFRNNV